MVYYEQLLFRSLTLGLLMGIGVSCRALSTLYQDLNISVPKSAEALISLQLDPIRADLVKFLARSRKDC